MNKTVKRVLAVIYYVFTFGLGVLLAITLPGLLKYDALANGLNTYITSDKYSEAMNIVGGFYDENYVYQKTFADNSGIVIFSAATLNERTTSEGKGTFIDQCYAGFLYRVKDKFIDKTSNETNYTKLYVTDSSNVKHPIELLNYDSDSDKDGSYDSISTLVECDYVYFEIIKEDISSVSKIEFVNANNEVYQTVSTNLSFTEQFFTASKAFCDEYNKVEYSNSKLDEYYNSYTSASPSFKMGNVDDISKKSTIEASIYVVVYFLVVYILGDILVGKRFIIRFFKWVHRKIHKKKQNEVETNEVYGTDYFTQLSYKLVVPEDCESDITLAYHNENDEIEIVLSKKMNYEQTIRVHAGVYANGRIEAPGYRAIDLSPILEVRGYKMSVTITLEKIEK